MHYRRYHISPVYYFAISSPLLSLKAPIFHYRISQCKINFHGLSIFINFGKSSSSRELMKVKNEVF